MDKGSYVLTFSLEYPTAVIVGKLGEHTFPPGRYAYVGSALNGLEARVARHFSPDKRRRWHIDHLLAHAVDLRALLLRSGDRMECFLSRMVGHLPGSGKEMDGFGSSDCGCETHLYHISFRDQEYLEAVFGPSNLVTGD
ncbi:MAG: GIY-YIG nuclease family protein [Methanomassiliicoccales archaeon]